MKIIPQFTEKELEDISEGLRIGAIHTVAPGENQRWHLLSQKVQVINEMNRSK